MNQIQIIHTEDALRSFINDAVKDAFEKLGPVTPEPEQLPDYLNLDQLINYLPSKPVKSTIYQLVSSKKIPCFRVNNRLFFNKKEIDKWVEGKRKPTTEQLDKYAEDFLNK